jgi:outer membrane protein assembly factor BamB
MRLSLTVFMGLFALLGRAAFHDWPMWRFDQNRSASSPEQLSDKLYLQWKVQYTPRTPVWDDPLNQNLMPYDRLFEPIVSGGKIFLGFNDQDKVIALDIQTGRELWHFYADGPVRLPLAAHNGHIYFTGDDGFCYCLDADKGALVWKISLAPAKHKLLGNKRLISMWPARGGIVIQDTIIYTAASIFPMMGTFIYAIHGETGETIWKNEGTGSNYILQPHNSPAFADVAPQGTFAIAGDKLLVAGGRSVPAAFDLKTGEKLYYQLAASGKTGGSFTCTNERVFFNHQRERMTDMYDVQTGDTLIKKVGEYPVIEGDTIYFSGDRILATHLNDSNRLDTLWIIKASAKNDLIKAGDCLYAADSSGISVIKIVDHKPQMIWRHASNKSIERLVASNGKLIAVSGDGEIMVFGDAPVSDIPSAKKTESAIRGFHLSGRRIIRKTQIENGYGVVIGTDDIRLLRNLVSKTSLSMVALDRDPDRIAHLRKYFDSLGVTADRLSFLNYEETISHLPKYFASLTIVTDPAYLSGNDDDLLYGIYESTRPYDGKVWIKARGRTKRGIIGKLDGLDLFGADLRKGWRHILVTKTGALEGAADWTHNYGNIANTVKSEDQTVKAPLGILWFGGNSNLDVLPRHGHGPSEQVIDGRLIIQGISSISARDVYTGRLIWKKEIENLDKDTWKVYYDETYDEYHPLDPKYNQVHIPGANARGTNFIATREYVYVITGRECLLLDIRSGKHVKTFSAGDENSMRLAYIGIYEDLLILGNDFSTYPDMPSEEDDPRRAKFRNFNTSASRELIVMSRFSGKKLWNITANHGFIHNSVIAGRGMLFCLDKYPQSLETKLKRRGEDPPPGSRLLYLDVRTGEKIFEDTTNIFGSWLGYSSEHKLLLQANRPSRDMLSGENGERMIAYNILTKETLWDKPVTYFNPPILSDDKIYTEGSAYSLLTGDSLLERDPITGEEVKWNFKREYGCGYVVASEHLLTFRSASAGFVNLDVFEGTGSLGGFKAGCSANLIVANGVLNAPDYTRTCQCAYQNQTSLALIHMPWMTYWTNSNYIWNGKQIRRLGLNLNAPGDRTSDRNTLWMEFPYVAGADPEIPVKMDTIGYYEIRKDPISITSKNTPWISASSIGGIRSMEIQLAEESPEQELSYLVYLYFSEPEKTREGERIFDIILQDGKVLENFDIIRETGQADKEIIKSFPGIRAGRTLILEMVPKRGNTIISGIELIEEGDREMKSSSL